jgi:hypothetical protein
MSLLFTRNGRTKYSKGDADDDADGHPYRDEDGQDHHVWRERRQSQACRRHPGAEVDVYVMLWSCMLDV